MITFCLIYFLLTNLVFAGEGNITIPNFSSAKKIAREQIFYDHQKTFYCDFEYKNKKICLPDDFKIEKFDNRKDNIEWEHIVPAERFGKSFDEWKNPKICGDKISSRKCAETNVRFRFIESDLHNLVPASGAFNALRSNNKMAELPFVQNYHKHCNFKVYKNKIEPDDKIKGMIARTYMYMMYTYPEVKISDDELYIIMEWEHRHPVTKWECERNRRIKNIQGNTNPFVEKLCK